MTEAAVHTVSIVVPTRNCAAPLEACLRSARRQHGVTTELIVVDNHSTDGTQEVARRYADRVLVEGPERSAQRNAGIAIATSSVVLVIDSDMTLDRAVARQAAQAFADDPSLGAVVLPELAAGSGRWARCRGLEKTLYIGRADVEAARGFRRRALLDVGGYDTSVTGLEDWDLPDRMRAAGWRIGRIAAPVTHHETVSSLRELFAKKRYYGRGSAAHVRAGRMQRPWWRPSLFTRPGLLLRHPVTAAGLVAIKVVEAAGFVVGVQEARWAADRPRRAARR